MDAVYTADQTSYAQVRVKEESEIKTENVAKKVSTIIKQSTQHTVSKQSDSKRKKWKLNPIAFVGSWVVRREQRVWTTGQ